MINLRKMATWYLFSVAVLFSVEVGFYRWAPVTWWFEYDRIEVASAPIGGPIKFRSHTIIRQQVSLQWNDVLYCRWRENGRFVNFTNQRSELSSIPPGDNRNDGTEWTYSALVPYSKATCYLRSVATALFKYGIRRDHRVVKTDVFTLK